MIHFGLQRCLEDPPAMLRGKRFGLLMNQASVDSEFRYACDRLAARFPGQLAAIFSPQHGLWGEQQANMIESPHGRYEPLDVPVYSLYSETRRPSAEMLRGLDCLVVDLQDVGTRVYTFIWTISHGLEACADAQIPVLILDRPNPLGGEVAEGPLLESGFESFVGRSTIPMRHGLTLGELSLLVNHELKCGAQVEVVPVGGLRSSQLWPETACLWTAPSPNMPRWETAAVYPGQVLLEGTNLSEGRGTTLPFELVGAPFIDPLRLAEELDSFELSGVRFRPLRFVPTFDKWQGKSCGGVGIHVTDASALRSFRMTLAILAVVSKNWPSDFAWLPPPYEYEHDKMPIDILYGSDRLRKVLDQGAGLTVQQLDELCLLDETAWQQRTASFRLYDGRS